MISFGLLHDRVPGADDDRTEGRGMPVIESAVVHRDGEEAGRAEGLDRRIGFLEVPAE